MCNEAVHENPPAFIVVPDCFKTQEMCNKVVNDCPWCLKYVHDHLKTREMHNEAVDWRLYLLQHVPDWFVTQQVKPWHNDILIEWYEGYKKRKAQKAKEKDD